MMIKLTKQEVEEACTYWLRAKDRGGYDQRYTTISTPVAIDEKLTITCRFTRSGVECEANRTKG